MPILPVDSLFISFPALRRAHLVLSFLLHFYVHSEPSTPPTRIPVGIAQPLLEVSHALGLPPVVTYADTVLYNFESRIPDAPASFLRNPPERALATFTGLRSEEQFYVISALCEIAGAEALRLMRRSLDELFLGDELALKRLTTYLRRLAIHIDRIGDITLSMIKNIDPEEFYHVIRPWFRGGDADGQQSLGWLFDDGENDGLRPQRFSGPSAGQSSLIHAIDIFLTVDHSESCDSDSDSASPARPSSPPIMVNDSPLSPVIDKLAEKLSASVVLEMATHVHPAETPTLATAHEATFLQRMLQYMPLAHRTFLLHLSTQPAPLRSLVFSHAMTHPQLAAAYDEALAALQRFREKHMRIVSIFIVQQARRQPSERVQKILGTEGVTLPSGELRGTGGTALFQFLKRTRDNTTKAMIHGGKAGYELE